MSLQLWLLSFFVTITIAASLGLLEEQAPNTPLTVMIQSVNRFLLDKMATDFRQIAPQAGYMDQVRQMRTEEMMRVGVNMLSVV